MRPLVYAHLDADGITSARIATLSAIYKDATVQFTPPLSFGVRDIDPTGAKSLLCLDIGSTKETIEQLAEWSDTMQVILIDHHPTDVNLMKYQSPTFRIIHDVDNCTAGLTLNTMLTAGVVPEEKRCWAETWAIVGIYGDVAKDKLNANALLQELERTHPHLISQLGSKYSLWYLQAANVVANTLNAGRKYAFSTGAKIAYNSLVEAEQLGNPFALTQPLPLPLWSVYPNIVLLQELKRRFTAVEIPEATVYDLKHIAVAMFTSAFDMGAAVAKKTSRWLNKPVIAINDGILQGSYRLNGRGEGLDLNLLMQYTKLELVKLGFKETELTGGGHPSAVGGLIPAGDFGEVIQALGRASIAMVEGEADVSDGEEFI